jgi:hypothetical protein
VSLGCYFKQACNSVAPWLFFVFQAILPLCADIPRAVSELLAILAGQSERTFAVPASSPASMEHGLRVADAFVEVCTNRQGLHKIKRT